MLDSKSEIINVMSKGEDKLVTKSIFLHFNCHSGLNLIYGDIMEVSLLKMYILIVFSVIMSVNLILYKAFQLTQFKPSMATLSSYIVFVFVSDSQSSTDICINNLVLSDLAG